MNALWVQLLRPFWLLLLPLLAWLLWRLWQRRRRRGLWQAILPVHLQPALLGSGRRRGQRLPWVLLGLVWVLGVLALMGPSFSRVEQHQDKPADPLVIVLQLTPTLLAPDTPPNRLEQARRKIIDLLRQRGAAPTAIVVYAGSAHTLVPLSDDLGTSLNLLAALKPSIMPQPGQRADLGVSRALHLLANAGQGRGRILLMAGEVGASEREGIARALTGDPAQLTMLGLGTPEGAPVTLENGELLKDDSGAIVLPRLDSPSLRSWIGDLGGRYQQARLDDRDLARLGLLDHPRQAGTDAQTVQLDTWADQGYWLLLPILLLAALAGRRGWLLGIALLVVQPKPADAFELADLWQRPDQQGAQLLEQGRPAEAAQRFEDFRWKGVALYQAGDYNGAAAQFARGNRARDHFNRGNALARAGELAAAVDAYDQALELQPDLQAAQQNRTLVQQRLRQLEAEKAPPKPTEQPPEAQPQAPDNTSATSPEGQASNPDTDTPPPSAAQPDKPAQDNPADTPPPSGTPVSQAPGDLADATTKPPARPTQQGLDGEQRQALEQWLRQIPDEPSQLLRRKFWYEDQLQDKHP